MYFEDGKVKEEGSYEDDTYRITNSWDIHGSQNVKEGQGIYKDYYADGEYIFESGKIENGLREGIWKVYYEFTENVYSEQNYKNGRLSGIQKLYYESNQLYCEGEVVDGLKEGEWSWYYENGTVSSMASFRNDKKEGEQLKWNEYGEITIKEYYENGECIDEEIMN